MPELTPDLQVLLDRIAQLETENAEVARKLREALEQQTATAAVLEIIASSPTDVQPVLDAIVESAARVCGANDADIRLLEGDELVVAATFGKLQSSVLRISLGSEGGPVMTAFLERRAVSVADAQSDEVRSEAQRVMAREVGYRALLIVPLRRENEPIGTIGVRRVEPGAFSDKQVQLLETFAAQAVIAVENVRLFTELRDSLEQQTAMSEVLEIIAGSPTDVQPVLDAICASAAQVCAATDVTIRLREGDEHRQAAHHGLLNLQGPNHPVNEDSPTGRAILQGRTIHVPDMKGNDFPNWTSTSGRDFAFESLVAAPLMREGVATGTIVMMAAEPNAFTTRQVRLLESFAAQAVIAIENVRLFHELQQKTLEQAETLEEQAATNHILEIISQSPTDVQPVLNAICESAARICEVDDVYLRLLEGDEVVLRAHVGPIAGGMPDAVPFSDAAVQWQAQHGTLHIHDLQADERFPWSRAHLPDVRSLLMTPLMRGTTYVGGMAIRRLEVQPFSDRQVALLDTFAAQAVIAIENVRLFHELEERNTALREALEHQTATAEVLNIISRSPTDAQPVLEAICESAARVCAVDDMHVRIIEGDMAVVRAHVGAIPTPPERPVRSGGMLDQIARLGVTMHYQDMQAEAAEEGQTLARSEGFHTALFVPLRAETGGILVARRTEVRPFSVAETKLLETFADQAVIAIENARLFEQLQERNRDLTESLAQQTATAEVLEVMSAAPEQLQVVLDAVAERATQVCNANDATIYIERDGVLHHAARWGQGVAAVDEIPLEASRMTGQAFTELRAIHVPDALASDYVALREAAEQAGARAYLAVPLIHEGRAQGVVVARRMEPQPFTERQIELLKTFADQGAIAITLSRLIEEIRDKNEQLEVASHHKSEFLANMSHELRTPLNAIIGFSEVLSEQIFGDLNERQADYINDIVESGKHLLSLINDILDLSKVEAGQMELELGLFSLPEALENGITMIRERAANHGIALSLEVDPALDEITADERKVKQVLFNLLSNAVKFTPDGGEVVVRARPVDTTLVEISVTDTGVGVAPEDQERIFEEFQQARDSATKATAEGTGLGLALARRFVELHGGRIWVESEVGKGSTFTFAIPIEQPHE